MEPAGVTRSRAIERRARIGDLSYDLHLRFPSAPDAAITGSVRLSVELIDAGTPLVMDFAPAATHLGELTVNGSSCVVRRENGHVIIPPESLRTGSNAIDVDFAAGETALHRRGELVYSLFVPARASHAFPCFDQPDLKARWRMSVDVPPDWTAIGNEPVVDDTCDGEWRHISFQRTPPLPTYLVTLVAGRLAITSGECGTRAFRIIHAEPDQHRVNRDVESIVEQHARALDWLEAYTAIPYPFTKLDVVLLPSFQFTGMEHPGAIDYDADALLLDATATPAQHLRRADVIAHEVAHMWFGNLVTMPWFDDVWLKEVFAGFMASRIVASHGPDADGADADVRFFVQHHPAAHALDRSTGAVAVRQLLDNLDEAGLVYGPALYHKAPIAMRQLEGLIGADALRDGVRAYLAQYAFGNAGWPELAAILDDCTPFDVPAWGRAWIEAAGRPVLSIRRSGAHGDRLVVEQEDEHRRGLSWPQVVDVACGDDHRQASFDVVLVGRAGPATDVPGCRWALASGLARAYGRSDPDDASLAWLIARTHLLADARTRAASHAATWEAMLDERTGPATLLDSRLTALDSEPHDLIRQLLFTQVRELFWRWLSDAGRDAAGPDLEAVLRNGLSRARSAGERAAWFTTLSSIARTPHTLDWLRSIWRRSTSVPGLPQTEADEAQLALELAARHPDEAEGIIEAQIVRCVSRARQSRLRVIAPALAGHPRQRSAFVEQLRHPASRRPEGWIVDALGWLHHPARAIESTGFIGPGLSLLADVQRTGDIFLPQRWVTAILSGHRTHAAAEEVARFIESLPDDYPPRLRRLLISVADPLFRAAARVG